MRSQSLQNLNQPIGSNQDLSSSATNIKVRMGSRMGSQEALSIREEEELETSSPDTFNEAAGRYNNSRDTQQTALYSAQNYSHTAESSFASGVNNSSRNMSHGKAASILSNFSNQSASRVSCFPIVILYGENPE